MSPEERAEYRTLTQSEQRTYQSLRARGWSHDVALNDALDGVDIETVRESNPRPDEPHTHGAETVEELSPETRERYGL